MPDISLLWIPATLVASAGQVARNTMQRRLTDKIGTLGATQVRFLFGLPFALLFLAVVLVASGQTLPRPGSGFPGFMVLGALSQIGATALMLAAMRHRSFSVVTALLKTEAIQIAVFGFVVLGDRLPASALVSIIAATTGVLMMTASSRMAGEARQGGAVPILFGLAAAALFAFSAVGFRGAILALDAGNFLLRATTALAWSLLLQTSVLLIWLLVFDRRALLGSFGEWRSSLFAGFLGAGASQFWFIGFALTAAANVRTLALVEVVLAQAVSRRIFAQSPSRFELAGMGLIAVGVLGLLANAQ